MNLESITLVLRTAFMLNPQPKPEPLFVSKEGIILYSMNGPQSACVILLNESCDLENPAMTQQWKLPANLDQLNKALITSTGKPLLKNLSSDRIEPLNETGEVGAICLEPRERAIMEAYISRHWNRVLAFPLDQILEYGVDRKLKNPDQIDIFIRFNKALKDNKITPEYELKLA